RTEKRTDNPARAFVSEISKEIYDADDEDEAERRFISHYPLINTRLRLCNFCVAGELTRTEAWKCRSTNVEVRGNGKMTKIEEMLGDFASRHLGFVIDSSFGFRHFINLCPGVAS